MWEKLLKMKLRFYFIVNIFYCVENCGGFGFKIDNFVIGAGIISRVDVDVVRFFLIGVLKI